MYYFKKKIQYNNKYFSPLCIKEYDTFKKFRPRRFQYEDTDTDTDCEYRFKIYLSTRVKTSVR